MKLNIIIRTSSLIPLVTLFFLSGGAFPAYRTGPDKLETPIQYPDFGKYVLSADGEIADWLGEKFDEKTLREPINVILIDPKSRSEEESIAFLRLAMSATGYPERFGHSSGYVGTINGKHFSQIPDSYRVAFSSAPTWETNYHGRFFGPAKFKDIYFYSGSFSKESFTLFAPVHHNYLSFEEARENLNRSLVLSGLFEQLDDIDLYNKSESSLFSTGDHTGKASVFVRK